MRASTYGESGAAADAAAPGPCESEAFPARARAIAARYPVGNHTHGHPHPTRLSAAAIRAEVRRGASAIRAVAAKNPRPWFRFPFGDGDVRTIRIVDGLGYGAIGWTVDTLGWQGRAGGQSVQSVVRRVLDGPRPGAIVLMRVGAAPDGTTLDADAPPKVIAALGSRGYALVTVREFVR